MRTAISPKAPGEVVATDLPRRPSNDVHTFLAEQIERASVHGGRNVNDIRACEMCGDCRSAALVNIDSAREHALNRRTGTDCIDGYVKTMLGEITGFLSHQGR